MAFNPRVWSLSAALLSRRRRRTGRGSRLFFAGAVVLNSSCQPRPQITAPTRCGPAVPESAQHPLRSRAVSLAGDYDLIQVRTQPNAGVVATGRLHLAPPDSAARAGAVGGAVRDLVGWLDPTRGDAAWSDRVRSRNPALPGAVLAGDRLQLGDIGYYDGNVVYLHITAVAPEGFWGWWKADTGFELTTDPEGRRVLPDAAGYFCALRVPS